MLKRQFCFEKNSGQSIKVTSPKIHALTLSSIVNFQQIKPLSKNLEVFNLITSVLNALTLGRETRVDWVFFQQKDIT
jgi:hypothetical protein